ncbi:MAG: hypothetical protein RMI89_06865 [Gloeomargarita sp. SKYBB_i_bin120]|nr:hypothetical protein [Gloeomargarita sp. SKYG98]MCS7292681.1 hypothetical protein [Gloeomargarita sp. SKYB120]MDW8178243.1 hypothetical protein [Gloeomargarita sp. SKYBB_i_bin120]
MYGEPPYLLLLMGLLAALASGSALNALLRQAVQSWQTQHSTRTLADLRQQLRLPVIGINGGITGFLTAGLYIFGFPWQWSLGAAVGLAVLTTWLVWVQLNRLLGELERGNRAVLSLDNLFF